MGKKPFGFNGGVKLARSFDEDQIGFLYFITSDTQDACKIGFATDVYQRLKTLQTGNPDKLQLRISIAATLGAEMALHRKLAARRIHLEWFWDRSDFLLCLEEHLDDYVDNKPPLIRYLTADDVERQFSAFMEAEGHRYPDEHDTKLLAEIAAYRSAAFS